MDLDSIAFVLNSNNELIHTVYFAQKSAPGVRLNGDSLTGAGDGDDEIISVDFSKLPKHATRICLYANIFSFISIFKKDFSKVKGAYIRLVDTESNRELCRYSLTDSGKGFNAFHFADLVKDDADNWSFVAIGEGCSGSVHQLESKYKK